LFIQTFGVTTTRENKQWAKLKNDVVKFAKNDMVKVNSIMRSTQFSLITLAINTMT